jgi:hypothetical protein
VTLKINRVMYNIIYYDHSFKGCNGFEIIAWDDESFVMAVRSFSQPLCIDLVVAESCSALFCGEIKLFDVVLSSILKFQIKSIKKKNTNHVYKIIICFLSMKKTYNFFKYNTPLITELYVGVSKIQFIMNFCPYLIIYENGCK